jgi:hypothetical protein
LKKRRTREHIISELSVNYVEKQILLCNHSSQRVEKDYGYDLQMMTYNETGEIENGLIYLQLKATDKIKVLSNGETISFVLESKDIELWYNEIYPVYVILYDALVEEGYWINIRKYMNNNKIDVERQILVQDSLTVHFKRSQTLDSEAIELFRTDKNQIHNRFLTIIEMERGRFDDE